MASVPVSFDDLQNIAADCARDLLEKWAIESDLKEEDLPEYAAMAAETAAFVIDSYMGYLNAIMEQQANPFK